MKLFLLPLALSLGFLLPIGSRAADIEWEPDVYPHGNLFPAFESDDLDYQVINVEKAREMGILPITYSKKDEIYGQRHRHSHNQ